MQERKREREHDDEERQRREKRKRAPGRHSASAELDGPTEPSASGIVMRKATGDDIDPEAAGAAVRKAGSSSGFALPAELRAKFERSTGMDLGGVRVHTGNESQEAAHAIRAEAYAVGTDVHFAAGQYQPDSPAGQELIAHEVFHTLQAPQGAAGEGMKVSDPNDGAELEADRAAAAMVAGEQATAPAQAAGNVVHRKKNSYSAQEGLTWENGTALQDDEIKEWATQKQKLAGAAGGFIAWATGFKVSTGADELVEKLKEKSASEYDKEIETLEHEVEGCEDQVDEWDDKRSSGALWWKKTNKEAEENYQYWVKLLAEAEADLEALENQRDSREARWIREANSVVSTIKSYASKASSAASAVGSELGVTAPSQFKGIDDVLGKIGKVTQALEIGSRLFDTTALNAFKANPNLQTAEMWASHVGGIFESLAPLAEGLPGGWGTVISGMLSMPNIVTKQFLAVMKKRYDMIDEETRDGGESKNLPEGTSG